MGVMPFIFSGCPVSCSEIESVSLVCVALVIDRGSDVLRLDERNLGDPPSAYGSIRFAHGARRAVSALRVTILSQARVGRSIRPARARGQPLALPLGWSPDTDAPFRARALLLTPHSTPGYRASRTSRSPQFSAAAEEGGVRKSAPPLAAAGGRVPRSLTRFSQQRRRLSSEDERRLLMTTFNALELIPTVAAIRGDVLANRDGCKTDFARSVHDTLLGKLDDITADLHAEVATEHELAAAKGTPDGDEWYEIYQACTSFEYRWVESGPISLADQIYEDIAFEGETCRVGLDYTLVPNSELEGLAKILDTIRLRLCIEFIAARI
jgi:hypothetical protein